MKEKHPILLHFDETKRHSFPLVLIVGREPNSDLEVVHEDGTYDFRKHSSALWNIAYELMAEAVGLQSYQLKKACEETKASPIIFGNSLPITIPNKVP